MACDKLTCSFYPTDEMGNSMVSADDLDEQGIDPIPTTLTNGASGPFSRQDRS